MQRGGGALRSFDKRERYTHAGGVERTVAQEDDGSHSVSAIFTVPLPTSPGSKVCERLC